MDTHKRSRALAFIAIICFFLSIAMPRQRAVWLILGLFCVVISLRRRKQDTPPPAA